VINSAKAINGAVHRVAGEVGLSGNEGDIIRFAIERAEIGFSNLQVRPVESGLNGGGFCTVKQARCVTVGGHVEPARTVLVASVRPGQEIAVVARVKVKRHCELLVVVDANYAGTFFPSGGENGQQ
jgi:hypothetical protein